jgi:hypothetical protein
VVAASSVMIRSSTAASNESWSERLAVAALAAALGSGLWLAWPLLVHPQAPAPAGRRRRAIGPGNRDRLDGLLAGVDGLEADRGLLENAQHLVATGNCPRCGWVMVASVRVPTSGPTPDTVVARAACPACAARAVGIVDPARANRVVWLDLPPAGGAGPMEGVA